MNEKPVTTAELYACSTDEDAIEIRKRLQPYQRSMLRSKPVSLIAWAKKACPACRGMWSQYGSHGKKWSGYKCPSDDCKGNDKAQDRKCSHCGSKVDHDEEPDICRSCIADWFSDSKQNYE